MGTCSGSPPSYSSDPLHQFAALSTPAPFGQIGGIFSGHSAFKHILEVLMTVIFCLLEFWASGACRGRIVDKGSIARIEDNLMGIVRTLFVALGVISNSMPRLVFLGLCIVSLNMSGRR